MGGGDVLCAVGFLDFAHVANRLLAKAIALPHFCHKSLVETCPSVRDRASHRRWTRVRCEPEYSIIGDFRLALVADTADGHRVHSVR